MPRQSDLGRPRIHGELLKLGLTIAEATVGHYMVGTGDTVLFGKYSGTEIKLDGEDYIIMREDEILGVIETDK